MGRIVLVLLSPTSAVLVLSSWRNKMFSQGQTSLVVRVIVQQHQRDPSLDLTQTIAV